MIYPGQALGVIDIGNSGIKMATSDRPWELVSDSLQIGIWESATNSAKLPPPSQSDTSLRYLKIDDARSIAQMLSEVRSKSGLPLELAIPWFISSVQPEALATLMRAFQIAFPSDQPNLISHAEIAMTSNVDGLENVGIDRLLAAWGAWELHQHAGPIIVVQAGTAVTIDVVSATGCFEGGAIMPGVSLALKFLALGTARLPWLSAPHSWNQRSSNQLSPSQTPFVSLPGKNTEQAMLAGVFAAVVGGIEYLIQNYRKKFDKDGCPCTVFVSGGDGIILANDFPHEIRFVDQLVLKSLARLGNLNQARGCQD